MYSPLEVCQLEFTGSSMELDSKLQCAQYDFSPNGFESIGHVVKTFLEDAASKRTNERLSVAALEHSLTSSRMGMGHSRLSIFIRSSNANLHRRCHPKLLHTCS
mmetsp:Transcript_26954/g.45740  ORF Transcript_26954/g.45740 Transcript_26954/m.45740 type:complete len:104 (+) Transcript_26954:1250-1561(+)